MRGLPCTHAAATQPAPCPRAPASYRGAAMRVLLCGSALALASCSSFPVPANPAVNVSPYLARYQLRGDVAMQNNPGTGVENNATQSIESLGQGSHGDDFGIRADIGDGFTGIRIDYYRMDLNPSGPGTLTDDLGAIASGDAATLEPRMDEWRLAWTQSVMDGSMSWRGDPVRLQGALGATLANRDLSMDVLSPTASQGIDQSGNSFYGTARGRATLRQVSLDVEYSLCPELHTGDWEGMAHDFETRISYAIPFQDVTVFAGYRYTMLEGGGSRGGLAHDTDLVIDGYQIGVTVTF